jgi:putative membrane protein
MNRRTALVSLAAAAAVSPVLAQTSSGSLNADHIRQTLATGAAALATSRIALQRGRHPWVKTFAQYEVAEQETIADVLSSMEGPQTTSSTGSGGGAGGSAAGTPPALDAKGQQLVDTLQKAQDAQFDRDYVRGQLQGHQELLAIQENFLKQGGNREEVNVAKLARGQIREHISLLEMIDKELQKS